MSAETLVPPLRNPVARILLVGFVALHGALAIASAGFALRSVAALALTCGAAGTVVLTRRLRRPHLFALEAATLAGAALVIAALPVGGWPGYAAWPAGAVSFIALALTVRGRIAAAWTLMGGLVLEALAWSLLAGAGPLPGLDLVVRHVGTLLLGTLFAIGLRRAARAVLALGEQERDARAISNAVAAAAERRRAAAGVLALAGPALQALADGGAPDRPALLALEGRLRDQIGAPALISDRLNAALAGARRRGVDVVLLEDLRGIALTSAVRERIADWLAARADDTERGRFVARLTQDGGAVRVSARSGDRDEVLEFDP